jgi:seryl-tRNA synthetase
MLDIKFIREHKEAVQENARLRKSTIDIDDILRLDDGRKTLQSAIDTKRAELNTASKQKPTDEEITKLRTLGEEIKKLEDEIKTVQGQITDLLSWVPNMSSPDMPIGAGEHDNPDLKVWLPDSGYLPSEKLGKDNEVAQYMPVMEHAQHHVELGEALDMIDTKQSALTSGSRFVYLKNDAVLLQYAIFNLLSKKLIEKNFVPMIPPVLVREKVLFGTSHFPEGRDQVYKIESTNVEDSADLYLVGSSEPSLFAYHMDKTHEAKNLPYKMFALTSCFRSEVGSWGKDVRGIKRVHQFDKLEMDVVCTADQSEEIMAELLEVNEWMLQALKLPYRVINKCTGDCGYLATYKQYDIEAWLPGQKEFMEVMTDTNATDYQARRMNIRYTKDGEKHFAHTVNDTGVAMGRMIIAIMDNYQNPDGTITVPQVLREYMGKDKISSK